MAPTDGFTREERERIAKAARAALELACPRCGAALMFSSVAPDPAVAYVRKRVLAVCTGCHRSVALDAKR